MLLVGSNTYSRDSIVYLVLHKLTFKSISLIKYNIILHIEVKWREREHYVFTTRRLRMHE